MSRTGLVSTLAHCDARGMFMASVHVPRTDLMLSSFQGLFMLNKLCTMASLITILEVISFPTELSIAELITRWALVLISQNSPWKFTRVIFCRKIIEPFLTDFQFGLTVWTSHPWPLCWQIFSDRGNPSRGISRSWRPRNPRLHLPCRRQTTPHSVQYGHG